MTGVPIPTPELRASLLVPCFNEEQSLPTLLDEVRHSFDAAFGESWELILVDDGSSDATAAIIASASQSCPRVKGVILSRNFGHQPALSAGLRYCSGRSIGIIDADLQDPIDVLMTMYRKIEEEDYDVVYGIRKKRDASFFLVFAYSAFYKLMSRISDHDWPRDAGDFCVMNKRCADIVNALPENVRMLRGMRSWIGFRQAGVPYERPKRAAGTSHYSFWKLSRLSLDAIIGFSTTPLRMASMLGFIGGLASLAIAFVFLLNRLAPNIFPFGYDLNVNPGITTLALLTSLLGSAILICIGILGEYIGIVLKEVKGRPTSLVAREIGFGPKEIERR